MQATYRLLLVFAAVALIAGCSTPDRYISSVRLGMNYDEVLEVMGQPFAVRAAKLYEDQEWQDVWEYRPPIFSLAALTDKYDRTYWVQFQNGRVVQYGEPGDFSYSAELSGEFPTQEYSPVRDDD